MPSLSSYKHLRLDANVFASETKKNIRVTKKSRRDLITNRHMTNRPAIIKSNTQN